MNPARLRGLPFFGSMSEQDLAAVAQQTNEMSVAAGSILAREGELGDEFFVIESGTAEVTRGGAPVANMGAGELLRRNSAHPGGTPDRDGDGHVADGPHRHDGLALPLARLLDTRDPRNDFRGPRRAASDVT